MLPVASLVAESTLSLRGESSLGVEASSLSLSSSTVSNGFFELLRLAP